MGDNVNMTSIGQREMSTTVRPVEEGDDVWGVN